MIVFSGKSLSQRVCVGAWRTFASLYEKEPYWRSKFPDRIASFDEIPTITEGYETRRFSEAAEKWFHKFGHVVKENMPFGKYNVHLFHFDDFRTVYRNDGLFPIRKSHEVLAQYRKEREHIYDNVGLGASQGMEWRHLRTASSSRALGLVTSKKMVENVADDLIKKIRSNLNDKGEIDLLPWLHRWAFENIGVVALGRRLNALSEPENELADKMVEAALITDELIALTTMEPTTDYEERFKKLVEVQDYFYSVLKSYMDNIKRNIDMEPEIDGVAQVVLRNEKYSENDAITLIVDLFQGSLQTVPLVALMALYNLALNSSVQAEAREEAKRLLPYKDSKYFDSTDPKDYIISVIYETLRRNPPIIGNGRVTQKDLILGGYFVPAYTNVILHHQVACLQEENFHEPLKFNPLREDYQKIMYVFGGSARTCLGKVFATRQLLLFLSKMLRNFEVFYDGGEIRMINKLHIVPEKPVILRFKPIDD